MSNKGQTTLIFIILIIIIFVGMATFLLSLASSISQSEYLNLYAHNLLSSILKTDTGHLESQCRTIADALACSFLSPSFVCGGQVDCYTLANEKINESMSEFRLIKEGFEHLITIEPEGFTVIGPGGVQKVEFGNLSLSTIQRERITANERISGIFAGESYVLNARLTITRNE